MQRSVKLYRQKGDAGFYRMAITGGACTAVAGLYESLAHTQSRAIETNAHLVNWAK